MVSRFSRWLSSDHNAWFIYLRIILRLRFISIRVDRKFFSNKLVIFRFRINLDLNSHFKSKFILNLNIINFESVV